MTDRGVSTALGYILGLAVVTALVSGLFFLTADIVTDEQERAIQSELEVIGNRLAADISTVDRLALSADNATVRLARELPETVAATSYQIVLTSDGSRPATIELETQNPDVTVSVFVMNGTAIGNSTASGGDITIRYNGMEVLLERA